MRIKIIGTTNGYVDSKEIILLYIILFHKLKSNHDMVTTPPTGLKLTTAA